MTIRCYDELILLPTFKERYEYLRLEGSVGADTFGFDRYLNQIFYKSQEWLDIRNKVIARDLGCDLGLEEREIYGSITVHHMNPISKEDILDRSKILLDPQFLISTMPSTHRAIHYGNYNSFAGEIVTVRTAGDTCPWKR
ncbi:hypothetical protein [Phocaeicola sp.]|jgi:hypothetical protein|uniref:hypothetical protein n=1 Tax=Phocaeicola sp. TaxID=2773926 RepID=UPI0020657D4B|nr:MAG TPA: HNH endonuclease bacteriophage, HNH Endonuclease, DNA.52A [Caudoviricetes sp.]